MNKLGKKIYINKNGYEVFVVYMRDAASTRISAEMYTVSPSGEMSDLITVPKHDLVGKKPLTCFLDLDGDFDFNDILNIKAKAVEGLSDAQKESTLNKSPLAGIHVTFSRHIRKNAEELQDNPDADIFIKGGYGYLRTDCMDKFVREHPELGYKRVEILKRLKIMGALENAPNRPYDMLISINNVKKRFYKVLLADESRLEEKPDEVIANADKKL